MDALLRFIENLAVIAFALSGIISARRRSMDIVGVYTVAFTTTFGGGTLRDILLDRRPFYWVQYPSYAILLLVLAAGSFVVGGRKWVTVTEKAIIIPDAFGLGLFAATGVNYALQANMPTFIATLMGVVTATFGGILRDILCNEVPAIFQSAQLYATCAFAGAWAYVITLWLFQESALAVLTCTAAAAILRLTALRYDWRLPT